MVYTFELFSFISSNSKFFLEHILRCLAFSKQCCDKSLAQLKKQEYSLIMIIEYILPLYASYTLLN